MTRIRLLGCCCLLASGCIGYPPSKAVDQSVSTTPAKSWDPPADAKLPPPTPPPAPAIPEEYLKPGTALSLTQIMDVGLRNNPVTRTAWLQARAAAADLGSKYSEYYPTIELDGSINRQKIALTGGNTALQTTYGPSASLTWLLLDFGGRSADVEEARRALYAADYEHNAAIQNVALAIAQSYYQYLNSKALKSAAEASLKAAQESLAAAQERHRAGVATIADELQARTVYSQTELALQSVEGQIQTLRGSLATAIGVPANIPVEAGELPAEVDVDVVTATVDKLIEQAEAQRPDLAAARLTAMKLESHVKSVQQEGLPSLFALGTAGRLYYFNPAVHPDTYSAGVVLRIPLFTGWQNTYDVLKAREDALAQWSQVETLQDQVILQVWTSYYNLKTASQQVRTARDLYASAQQSEQVALGRYRAGVGSILDLLAAQTAFANARASEIQARSNWFLSLAQLARDTGMLRDPVGVAAGREKTGSP